MAGRGSKPGERRGGRKKGTPNKLTKTVKEAFEAAFADAQADPADPVNLKNFKALYPKEFIAVCGRLIPTDVKATVNATIKAPTLEVVAAAIGIKPGK